MSTSIIGISFWIVVAIIVIASLLFSHFRNLEFQKTIRFAIEKGMQLDADSIEKLMRKKTREVKPEDFYVPGIICFSCCIGLLILGHFIAKVEPEAYFPIIGAGILTGVVSVGLTMSGVLYGIRERKEKKGSQSS